MDPAVERENCVEMHRSLKECGLILPYRVLDGREFFKLSESMGPPRMASEMEALNHYFEREWVYLVNGGWKRPTGYHMLRSGFHQIMPFDFAEYNECGPEADSMVISLQRFSEISGGYFIPENSTCSIIDHFYILEFDWRTKRHSLSLPATPDFMPLDELQEQLNSLLIEAGSTRLYWNVVPQWPTEEGGTIFAMDESLRIATDRGLLAR
ncbi:MAG TPA: hypothetical protein VEK08_13475 [Planctomycetota bacterium]|nr:hypothetical protein [Planctomycetota bacterium]